MTQRAILLYPDPVLRSICAPVTMFDTALRLLGDEMFQVMYAATGRGLAAPQIGDLRRVFVMDAGWKEGRPSPMIFVNPELVATSVDEVMQEEGCLSIPDQKVYVARPSEVTLRWQDLSGASQTGSFDGFQAVCVQHEMDHLDGILCIDYPRAS